MDNLKDMDHGRLVALKTEVDARLKEFRPLRIKMKWKRCGKKDCFCKDGPTDGSWGNLHGPYVFAQFVDRTTRKTRLVSLGTHYDHIDLYEVRNQILDKTDYFGIADSVRDKMSKTKQLQYNYYTALTNAEFKEKYGMTKVEDRMSRPTKFWGTEANSDAYEAEFSAIEAEKLACEHEWATEHGVGSPVGQKVLAELLRQNYYLVGI